jgi:hypothetical protein
MPSTGRKLELKAKTSIAQTVSQPCVYAKGLIMLAGYSFRFSSNKQYKITACTKLCCGLRRKNRRFQPGFPKCWNLLLTLNLKTQINNAKKCIGEGLHPLV